MFFLKIWKSGDLEGDSFSLPYFNNKSIQWIWLSKRLETENRQALKIKKGKTDREVFTFSPWFKFWIVPLDPQPLDPQQGQVSASPAPKSVARAL